MTKTAAILLAMGVQTMIGAQDPVQTDGDKYKTILENDKVRVLEYTDKPGEKTNKHHHPDFVLYALDSFKRRLTFGNGQIVEREFKKGDVIWMNDQIHTGENIGETNTHVILVEIKTANPVVKDTKKIPALEKAWKTENKTDHTK